MENRISKMSNAFTLIELLVVVAIIAMLMAIIFPLLARAMEMGKRANCSGNLKSLSLAWNMFASSNDGKLCSSGTNYNTESWHTNWACDGPDDPFEHNPIGGTEMSIVGSRSDVATLSGEMVSTNESSLWSYLKNIDVYKCPSDASNMVRSYSMAQSMGNSYRSLEQILEATEKIVFIDAKSDFSGLAYRASLLVPPEHYRHTWLVGSFSGSGSATNDTSLRHGGGSNMVFADGHTEFWKWSKPFSDENKAQLMEACKVGRIYE